MPMIMSSERTADIMILRIKVKLHGGGFGTAKAAHRIPAGRDHRGTPTRERSSERVEGSGVVTDWSTFEPSVALRGRTDSVSRAGTAGGGEKRLNYFRSDPVRRRRAWLKQALPQKMSSFGVHVRKGECIHGGAWVAGKFRVSVAE
jgi:hypothetical protein